MNEELVIQQVAVRFVGRPPLRQLRRAAGVRDVEAAGQVVRCVVWGSFQPFLEALSGHEVLSLESISTPRGGG
jgi:hypothetical protein